MGLLLQVSVTKSLGVAGVTVVDCSAFTAESMTLTISKGCYCFYCLRCASQNNVLYCTVLLSSLSLVWSSGSGEPLKFIGHDFVGGNHSYWYIKLYIFVCVFN